MEKIKICECHEYKVPLISTFAFNGSEYWCPYCGYTGGMLGAGKSVPNSELFEGRYAIYKEHSALFLRCNGLLVCAGTTFKGEKTDRKDIPKLVFDFARHYSSQWKYIIRASKLLKGKSPSMSQLDFLMEHGEILYPEGSPHEEDPFILEAKHELEA